MATEAHACCNGRKSKIFGLPSDSSIPGHLVVARRRSRQGSNTTIIYLKLLAVPPLSLETLSINLLMH